MKNASWVVVEIATEDVVCELWNAKTVECLDTSKYKAVPILQFLQEFNRKVKENDEH
jgi:hypothetical protein